MKPVTTILTTDSRWLVIGQYRYAYLRGGVLILNSDTYHLMTTITTKPVIFSLVIRMRPYHLLVPKLLEAGIRVLVYAGDADYVCNWKGNEAWVKALEWSGKSEFNAAKDKKWITEDVSRTWAGNVRSSGLLTWLRVFKAGHMVPHDQPSNSLDFFNRWVQNRKLCA